MELKYGQWQEKVREEQALYNSLNLTERARVAIITSMQPKWAQEYVYMHVQDSWTADMVWEKIRAMNANRADSGGPVPMDVGGVGGDEYEEYGEKGELYDVDGVNARCYNCGKMGHVAANCRSKGGGKGKGGAGAKGGGKDKPKGGGKDRSGYKGQCWTCGKTGHKAWECTQTRVAAAVEETQRLEEEEEGREGGSQRRVLGGVWRVGAVSIVEVQAGERSLDDVDMHSRSSHHSCSRFPRYPPAEKVKEALMNGVQTIPLKTSLANTSWKAEEEKEALASGGYDTSLRYSQAEEGDEAFTNGIQNILTSRDSQTEEVKEAITNGAGVQSFTFSPGVVHPF